MTIHLFFYLCSVLSSSLKEDRQNNSPFWQHFSTLFLKIHQYVKIFNGYYVADLLQNIWAFSFVHGKRGQTKVHIFKCFVKDIHVSVFQIVTASSKHALRFSWWRSCLIKFTEGTEIYQRATLTQHYCLPPTPVCFQGPVAFFLWKRFLGSCANELPLLLNDVCQLWPSLLPVNGTEHFSQ